MRKWKEELLEQRRKMMEEKLLHAEFKRELQLQAIVKKAQEEEAKVKKGIPWKKHMDTSSWAILHIYSNIAIFIHFVFCIHTMQLKK